MMDGSKKAKMVMLVVATLLVGGIWGGCRGTKADEPAEETEAARQQEGEAAEEAENEGEGQAAPAGGSNRYESPKESFSAPIPPGWKADRKDAYATMVSPEGDLKVHLMSFEADEIEGTLAKAWKTVGLERELEVQQTTDPPTPEGLDDLLVLTYKIDDEQMFRQAVGQELDGTIYVILVDGALSAVQKRASQVQIISSGFEIAGREETSLKDVAAKPFDADKQGKLAEHIEAAMKTFEVPGVSVGVVQDGEVVWQKGFGTRTKDGDEPVTPRTRMMVGSTTKTMTTMLMAKAVDDGKYDWDTPARKVLPKFEMKTPKLTEKVTMQHLVCACTGVPRQDLEILLNFGQLDAEGMFEQLKTFETYTDFGEAFQYSNQMVAAAGYITASSYGAEWGDLRAGYRDAMQTRIFEPIGMKATTVDFEEVLESKDHAMPHGLTLDGSYAPIDMRLERFVLPLAPAGAAWSTTEDMSRYLLTELSRGEAPDGTRVVSAKNLSRTWMPQVQISDEASYGLGWVVSETKGKRTLSHGGNTMGFTSALMFVPSDGLGITVLANAQAANAFADSIEGRLMELVYDTDLKAAESVKFAREQLTEQFTKIKGKLAGDVDEAQVEGWLGEWKNPALGEVKLVLKDEMLTADVGEFATRLRPKKGGQDSEDEAEGEAEKDVVGTYVMVEPPLVGAELVFKELDEGRRIIIGKGAQEYVFEPVKGE